MLFIFLSIKYTYIRINKKFYDIIDQDFVELLDYMNESWYNLDLSLVKDKVKKELKKK